MLHTLHGRVSAILLLLFLTTAALNVVWTLRSVRYQLMEADQRLNSGLADYLVKHEFQKGELSQAGKKLEHSFEMLMDINPNIELYLLDSGGRILAYSAPSGHVVRNSVTTGPILDFLSPGRTFPILGEDPRSTQRLKPFSAAPISIEGLNRGYLYIILGGEEHDSFFDLFRANAIFRISLLVSLTALLFLFATVFLLFRLATLRHRRLATTMEQFRRSDFSDPVAPPAPRGGRRGDEIHLLESVFAQMSERIGQQITQIRDKDRLRRELVSNVSHDLRTPIASLQGYLETLQARQERLPPEEVRQTLEKALRLTSHLGKLVTELLELARLDSLDLVAEKVPFAISDLVNDILMDFQVLADRQGITLTADMEEHPGLVKGDIRLLERAFQNLIENAIRFTPEGGQVSVNLRRNGDRVLVTVRDSGPGISRVDAPHIFERFFRGTDQRAGTGVGLGLAISQRIAQLHDTRIDLLNPGEAGASFSMELRIWEGDEAG